MSRQLLAKLSGCVLRLGEAGSAQLLIWSSRVLSAATLAEALDD